MLTILFIFIDPFIPVNLKKYWRIPFLLYQPAPPSLLGLLNDILYLSNPDVVLALLKLNFTTFGQPLRLFY